MVGYTNGCVASCDKMKAMSETSTSAMTTELGYLSKKIPPQRRWRVLVCGGRRNRDQEQLSNALDELWEMCGHRMTLIEGGHPVGTDMLALRWAQSKLPNLELLHMPEDLAAGVNPQERARILWSTSPDLLMFFPDWVPLCDHLRELAYEDGVPMFRALSRIETLR